jgi:hypothetical protein
MDGCRHRSGHFYAHAFGNFDLYAYTFRFFYIQRWHFYAHAFGGFVIYACAFGVHSHADSNGFRNGHGCAYGGGHSHADGHRGIYTYT